MPSFLLCLGLMDGVLDAMTQMVVGVLQSKKNFKLL